MSLEEEEVEEEEVENEHNADDGDFTVANDLDASALAAPSQAPRPAANDSTAGFVHAAKKAPALEGHRRTLRARSERREVERWGIGFFCF